MTLTTGQQIELQKIYYQLLTENETKKKTKQTTT